MVRRVLARRVLIATMVCGVLGMPVGASPQQPQGKDDLQRQFQALAWQRGPTTGKIGSNATITVREGQSFLDGPNTRRFLELNGNPGRDNHYTLVPEQASNWFAVFHFEDRGYIKDDEKLDADALLKTLRESDGPSNEERKRLGMAPLHTEGWHVPPHYDTASRRLEWGIRLRGDSGPVVNYTVRILGRRGVMTATLVSDPESLNRDIAVFRTSLGGFDFVAGERYAEFKTGDRMAEYGLAALVLGGAAVVATKTGFFKAFWKVIVFGVIAFGGAAAAFLRKLFRRS